MATSFIRILFYLSLLVYCVILLLFFNYSNEELKPIGFTSDPDEFRDTCQIVISRGFRCEVHHVPTSQGYILEMHRILPLPYGPKYNRSSPVMLQHGLTGTSADFIVASAKVDFNPNSVGQSLAFELAKRGYDVWLANNRGNRYGLRHLHLSSNDDQFWNFTFDQMSQFDIPSLIDYVRLITQKPRVSYVGLSQGTALMFALLSEKSGKRLNDIVETFVAIAPITRIGNARTWFRYRIALINQFYSNLNQPDRSAKSKPGLVSFICNSPLRLVCGLASIPLFGINLQLNTSRLGVYTGHSPSSTSLRNLIHFHQLFQTNQFGKFDYGPAENLKIYGQSRAPLYDLTKISHPSIYVIYTGNDWFVPLSSVEALANDIPGIRELYQVGDPRANHGDPLVGIDISAEVNHKIIHILARTTTTGI